MKVSFQSEQVWTKFLQFNQKTFPLRDAAKISKFRYKNPLNALADVSRNVIATDDGGKIIGQALYHPAEYYFDGKKHEAEWGFDFYVEKKSRNEAVGLEILNFIKNNKPDSIFATGVGPKALKIQKFYGYFVIGEIIKYYKIINPLYFLPALLPNKLVRFPERVRSLTKEYKKVKSLDQWLAERPFNEHLLEFDRTRNFMSWRFFSTDFNYAVYSSGKTQNAESFFVVRVVKIKNVSCLVLVDYRCDLSQPDNFLDILNSVEKLARKAFLPMVISGSSIKTADSVFESKRYKVQGDNRPIVSNNKEYKAYKQKADDRCFVFVTLADSDGEYLFK